MDDGLVDGRQLGRMDDGSDWVDLSPTLLLQASDESEKLEPIQRTIAVRLCDVRFDIFSFHPEFNTSPVPPCLLRD